MMDPSSARCGLPHRTPIGGFLVGQGPTDISRMVKTSQEN